MDNEAYTLLIDELLACRYTSDKLLLIQKQVHVLIDLDELFIDAMLSDQEITLVLQNLSLMELAVLLKQHPYDENMLPDLHLEERRLTIILHHYFLSLPDEKQLALLQVIKRLQLCF